MSRGVNENLVTYLAVGVPLGAFVPDEMAQNASCHIRRAGRFFQMPLEPYEWWSSALDGITEDDLRAIAARHHDLDDFADNLAWFLESRLLLPWTGQDVDVERFSDIRVIPWGIGAGNSIEDPVRFSIVSRQGVPAVAVDVMAYTIWSFCDGATTLEAVCRATADHLQMALDDVRHRALTLVPTLMRNGLAFLDLAA